VSMDEMRLNGPNKLSPSGARRRAKSNAKDYRSGSTGLDPSHLWRRIGRSKCSSAARSLGSRCSELLAISVVCISSNSHLSSASLLVCSSARPHCAVAARTARSFLVDGAPKSSLSLLVLISPTPRLQSSRRSLARLLVKS